MVLFINLLGKGLTQEINRCGGSIWWAPDHIVYKFEDSHGCRMIWPEAILMVTKNVKLFMKSRQPEVKEFFEDFGKTGANRNGPVIREQGRVITFEDGKVLAVLSLSGKTPGENDWLQILVKGAAIKLIASFMGEIQRPSKPSHLLFFKEWTILATSVGKVRLR